MPKNSLIAALMTIVALSIAGGTSADQPCEGRERIRCELTWSPEREGNKCFGCDWSQRGCSRAEPMPCIDNYYKFGDKDRIGDKNRDIAKVQQLLKEKNYEVDVTGTFDGPTKKAIESFQKQLKLPVDGIAGPETLRKLAQ